MLTPHRGSARKAEGSGQQRLLWEQPSYRGQSGASFQGPPPSAWGELRLEAAHATRALTSGP